MAGFRTASRAATRWRTVALSAPPHSVRTKSISIAVRRESPALISVLQKEPEACGRKQGSVDSGRSTLAASAPSQQERNLCTLLHPSQRLPPARPGQHPHQQREPGSACSSALRFHFRPYAGRFSVHFRPKVRKGLRAGLVDRFGLRGPL
ncbi:hypothetical protein NN561_014785 [Cricetulus griseus]